MQLAIPWHLPAPDCCCIFSRPLRSGAPSGDLGNCCGHLETEYNHQVISLNGSTGYGGRTCRTARRSPIPGLPRTGWPAWRHVQKPRVIAAACSRMCWSPTIGAPSNGPSPTAFARWRAISISRTVSGRKNATVSCRGGSGFAAWRWAARTPPWCCRRTIWCGSPPSNGGCAASVRYIANGIDCDRFRRRARCRRRAGPDLTVGTVAALRPEKNLAAPDRRFCRGAAARARIELAADDRGRRAGARRSWNRRRRPRRPSPPASFTGPTETPEQFLAQMDIFALSSDTEQMPLGVLEAMASGLPVAPPMWAMSPAWWRPKTRLYVTALDDARRADPQPDRAGR